EPLLFIKPVSSYQSNGKPVEIPQGCEVYHEVELAVVIGKGGRNITVSEAESHVGGYALALDMTARNVQAVASAAGLPWTTCKGLDTFTPISSFIPKHKISDTSDVHLTFTVNGAVRQSGSTSGLIYSIPFLISYASGIMTLSEGDVLLTGTPPGGGQVFAGDKIEAELRIGATGEILATLEHNVEKRAGGYSFSQKNKTLSNVHNVKHGDE
ncbi:hypothetical protein T439DRAFT_286579, partial [Meredithblackwellia eburnea MCA 4105]